MPRVRKVTEHAAKREAWKIGIYIRLSRENKRDDKAAEQRGKRGSPQNVDTDASGSIIEQDKLLTEWVTEHFSHEDYEIVDYFVDDGLSGTDDTRDEFQRLLQCAESGQVNCIVVKTLSRAFRNYADQGYYLEEVFPRLRVRFIATGNPFVDSYHDIEAIQSGMEIPINGLLNDRLAAKTSADVRRTFDAKRTRGEFIGAFAPYGYVKDPADKNSLLIDEVAAEHVRDIFHWFVVDGMSKRGIALKLNELGIPNPTAYKQQVQNFKYQNPNSHKNDGLWSEKKVGDILKDKMYLGMMVQGKQRVISYKVHDKEVVQEDEWFIVPDTHEAIIDEELFEKAQRLHSRDTRAAPEKREPYLFSGLLRCADCKKAMRRKPYKDYIYYYCRTATDKGKDACTSRSIREDRLMKAVLDAIQMQITLAGSLSEAIEEINRRPMVKTQSTRLINTLKLRKIELDKMVTATDNLYLDWKNGDITKEEYQRRNASFGEKIVELKEMVRNIEDEIDTLSNGVTGDDPYLAAFLKHRNITGLSRGIVLELIDTIYVHKDGQITIDFTFADELKRVLDFIENNQNDITVVETEAVS